LLNIQVNFSKCLQKLIWNTMGAGIGSFGKWDRTDPDWSSPKCLYFVHACIRNIFDNFYRLLILFNGISYDLAQSDHILTLPTKPKSTPSIFLRHMSAPLFFTSTKCNLTSYN
jgi:hypothetical protein